MELSITGTVPTRKEHYRAASGWPISVIFVTENGIRKTPFAGSVITSATSRPARGVGRTLVKVQTRPSPMAIMLRRSRLTVWSASFTAFERPKLFRRKTRAQDNSVASAAQ